MEAAANDRGAPILKIGIDFGTTNSAVAHALLNRDEANSDSISRRLPIERLRNVLFDGEKEVKSQLAWDSDDKCWIWGNEVDRSIHNGDIPESSRITMIKLGLDNTERTRYIREQLMQKLNDLPTECHQPSIEDLISIYLERLFKYAKDKIISSRRKRGLYDVFEVAKVECAICVPAIYFKLGVNQSMISAAERAGIPNPTLISEPDAAAHFMMQTELEEPHSVKEKVYNPFWLQMSMVEQR